jgi:hypothetical protein
MAFDFLSETLGSSWCQWEQAGRLVLPVHHTPCQLKIITNLFSGGWRKWYGVVFVCFVMCCMWYFWILSHPPAPLSSSMSAGMSIFTSSFCDELVKCSFSLIELLIQQKCFVIGINIGSLFELSKFVTIATRGSPSHWWRQNTLIMHLYVWLLPMRRWVAFCFLFLIADVIDNTQKYYGIKSVLIRV